MKNRTSRYVGALRTVCWKQRTLWIRIRLRLQKMFTPINDRHLAFSQSIINSATSTLLISPLASSVAGELGDASSKIVNSSISGIHAALAPQREPIAHRALTSACRNAAGYASDRFITPDGIKGHPLDELLSPPILEAGSLELPISDKVITLPSLHQNPDIFRGLTAEEKQQIYSASLPRHNKSNFIFTAACQVFVVATGGKYKIPDTSSIKALIDEGNQNAASIGLSIMEHLFNPHGNDFIMFERADTEFAYAEYLRVREKYIAAFGSKPEPLIPNKGESNG